MTPETRVKNEIIRYLESLQNQGAPIYIDRRQAGGFSYKKGLPDLYFVYDGTHIELEFKAPNGEASSMQLMWQRKFKELYNIDDYIVSSVEEVKEIIENLRNKKEGLR